MWSRFITPESEARPTGAEPFFVFLRIIAHTIDAIILTLINMVFALLVALVSVDVQAIYLAVTHVFIPALYFSIFWRFSGTSPGKKLTGLKITKVDGTALSWADCILRFLGYSLIGISIGRFLLNHRVPLLHDEIARTQILQVEKTRE